MPKVLVFGGAGSIGSELVRQLSNENEVLIFDIDDVISFDLAEELQLKGKKVQSRTGDIRDKDLVLTTIKAFEPDIIYHAAALKTVSSGDKWPVEYIKTNLLGTANILAGAIDYEVKKLVFISSDKAINLNSLMGLTKRIGELMVKKAGYISVRFGNVMGSRGSVLPLWQGQLDRNEPLTVTHPEMERFFMTIPEAVDLVIKAGKIGKGGETFILDMGKPVKILDLAKEILKKSGKDVGVKLIGVRPGETMTEKLMTEEEEKKAIKKGQFYILC